MGIPLPEKSPNVLVGVGAGIAAYKVALLVRAFRKAGWEVHVIPTPRSTNFVGLETWRELSENPVDTQVFVSEGEGHVRLARDADLIVLAPATADLLARSAVGMADDLLTTTVLASPAPVLACPAMHTQMWSSPATQANIETLRARGWNILEPASGPLSSGDVGQGRLPDRETIFDAAAQILENHLSSKSATGLQGDKDGEGDEDGRDVTGYADAPRSALAGARVVISAGGTREPLDPVRFLGNNSTGTQGVALAEAALDAGAHVTLLAANMTASQPDPSERLEVVQAPSAQDLFDAVLERLENTDVLIMAAAVADFRPTSVGEQKIKKSEDDSKGLTLTLERTPDILATVSKSPARPKVLVGFGAETGDEIQVLEYGAEKAIRKGADLLAVNRVGGGAGFGDVENTLTYFDALGKIVGSSNGTKLDVAEDLVGRVGLLLHEKREAETSRG